MIERLAQILEERGETVIRQATPQGMSIMLETGTNMKPTVRFDQVQESTEEVLQELADSMIAVKDKEFVQKHLFIRLGALGTLSNPIIRTTQFEDIEKGIYLELMDGAQANVSTEILAGAGISEEEAWQIAEENTFKISKVENWLTYTAGMMDEEIRPELLEDAPKMMVVRTERTILGAAAILSPRIQEELAQIFKKSYWLTPSSIHEFLAVEKMDEDDGAYIERVIGMVNSDVLPPGEVLGTKPILMEV